MYNYSEILEEIDLVLASGEWVIRDILPDDITKLVVLNIYQMNCFDKATAMDFEDLISVIASKYRISVIMDDTSSFYKADDPLCGYEDLHEDIENIFVILDAAVTRCIDNG